MKKILKARIIFSIVAITLVSAIVSIVAFSKPTYAKIDSLETKWNYAIYHNCITSGAVNSSLPADDKSTIASLMFRDGGGDNKWPLASYDYFENGKTEESCFDVSNNIIIPKAGLRKGAKWDDVKNDNAITKLGYSSINGAKNRINFFKRTVIYKNATEDVDTASGFVVGVQGTNGYTYQVFNGNEDDDYKLNIREEGGNQVLDITYRLATPFGCSGGMDEATTVSPVLSRNSVEESVTSINRAVARVNVGGECFVDTGNIIKEFSEVHVFIGSTAVDSGGYGLGDRTEASRNSIQQLTGNTNGLDGITPDENEYYDLYYWYLKKAIPNFGDDPISTGVLSCSQSSSGAREIHLKDQYGVWHRYYLNSTNVSGSWKTLSVEGDNVNFPDINLDFVIWWMNSHWIDESDTSCPNPAGIQSDNEEKKDGEDMCFENGGSLGWIVCPIIKGVSDGIYNFYEGIVADLLEIKVSAFNQNEGAYKAWQLFQSFANIVFVILFLVVILSQITGLGIDNLGIKRILPKLIIAAVLVNLSYIICMLLVDVSNIAGSGFYTLFDGVRLGSPTNEADGVTGFLAGLGFVGTGVVAAGATVAAIIWVPGVIPAILLGLITILISIVTMFVLLGIYQAGVIIAVVVSPIAFVLYMLPNTKPIFDRWRKLFQALLLLYPICGLMMGGANFAGKVLLNVSDSFWFSLLAALLSVIPFFFIPAILKNSMAAMGNIGNKISGLGKGISSKATGAVSNTEAFKDWQARRAAGVDRNGNRTARGRLMNRMAYKDGKPREGVIGRAARRRAARGEAAYLKRERELGNYNPDSLANSIAALDQERLSNQVATAETSLKNSEDFKSGNFDKMGVDMVNLMKSDQHGENAVMIRAYQNALNAVGEDGRSAMSNAFLNADMDFSKGPGEGGISKEARQAFSRNLMENHAADFKNNHRSLFEAAKVNNGEVGQGKFADFVAGGSDAAKIESYKPEQFANMDDEEFKRIVSEYNALDAKRIANGKLEGTDKERYEGMRTYASDVLSNDKLRSDLKGKRREYLEEMSSGYAQGQGKTNPGDAKPGESFDVHKTQSQNPHPMDTPEDY